MDALLHAKNWQIFLMTFGIVVIFIVAQVVLDPEFGITDLPIDVQLLEIVVGLVSAGTSIANSCWMYVVGMRLTAKRPNDSRNEGMFKTWLLVLPAYESCRNLIFPLMDYEMDNYVKLTTSVIMLLGYLYTDYFVAKALKSVEVGRETFFPEIGRTFFSFMFQPIGVWWLQPRINKIFEKESPVLDPDAPLDQHLTT